MALKPIVAPFMPRSIADGSIVVPQRVPLLDGVQPPAQIFSQTPIFVGVDRAECGDKNGYFYSTLNDLAWGSPAIGTGLLEYDRESIVLCDPITGAPVRVDTISQENTPPGTPPTIEAYNLNGTPYTGAIAALVNCPAKKYEVVDGPLYCAAGVTYSTTDTFDMTTSPPTLVSTLWRNTQTLAIVAAPAGAVVGACQPTDKTGAYQVPLAGSVTQANLPAIAAGGKLRSFSIMNRGPGNITFTGTDGNATALPPGTYNWTCESTGDTEGSFTLSANGNAVIITYEYQ